MLVVVAYDVNTATEAGAARLRRVAIQSMIPFGFIALVIATRSALTSWDALHELKRESC